MYGLIGFMDMHLWRFLERMDKLVACGYIDTLHFARIKCISVRCLKWINSRVVKRKVKQRARESHKKVFLEEVEEDEQNI